MTSGRFVLILIAILFLWGVHHTWSGPDAGDPVVAEERARNAPPPDRVLIENAEYTIQQGLRDPSSAEFRNDGVHIVADGRRVVCGEVNSKNGFGGYAGFQRFVATGRAAFIESEMEPKSFALVWKSLCTDIHAARPAGP